ncbi:MAG: DUF6677 family protein [Pyrinomonadaceae bacterium]
MNNLWFIGLISWFLPGIGHIKQGYLYRGIILGGVIWLMFIIGILSGGAYYPGYGFKDGFLLYLLNIFANFGNGSGYVLSYFFSQNAPIDAAARATFEYGGRFLEVAGLLNYLALVDASDIYLGRKK